MPEVHSSDLDAIIVIGELKDSRAIFGNGFDPNYSLTEGQFRSLYMRLSRLFMNQAIKPNTIIPIENEQELCYIISKQHRKNILYNVICPKGVLNEKIAETIQIVAHRGGVYEPKRFYFEIVDLLAGNINSSDIEDLPYSEAIQAIRNKSITNENLSEMSNIIISLSKKREVGGEILAKKTVETLKLIPSESDPDTLLDAVYSIATRYKGSADKESAKQLFIALADKAFEFERLALMITCRLQAVLLARDLKTHPSEILELLSPIDDGSLEVASQEEREMFYSLQGYCFEQLEDDNMAEEYHYMTVMISESETSPSIYTAESHAFLGKLAARDFQPDIATRRYLTAATIAQANSVNEYSNYFSHEAAKQEVIWARLLASTAIVSNMNSDFAIAEYNAWQALKRLVNALNHSDRMIRKSDVLVEAPVVLQMTKNVMEQSLSEYASSTISEIENHLNMLDKNLIPMDQEVEAYRFLNSKISAMLPLPPAMIMLIANDGRFIIGGEIGAESWDQAILTNDDLFSGALSAIMAILSEVISRDNPLRMLDAGQTMIMIEKSSVCIGALLVDRDLNALRKALMKVTSFMEDSYPELKDWDGYSIDFSGVKPKIDEIFSEAMKNIKQ